MSICIYQNRTYSLFSLQSYKDIRGTSIKYNTNGQIYEHYIYSFQFPDMKQ